jgi:Skp family chaperone for outer membrane proteins
MRQPKLSRFQQHRLGLLGAMGLLGWVLFLVGAISPTAPAKIAVVNTSRITTSSTAIQKLLADASTSANALGEEIKKKQSALQRATDGYNSQLSVTSDEENKRRREEIRKLSDEVEELTFKLNREVKLAQEKSLSPLRDRIVQTISEIAKTGEIGVVLATENTVYFDPRLDLTDAVIAKIDAKPADPKKP